MQESVFSTLAVYFKQIFQGIRSTARSSFAALPYLFSAGDLHKEVTELYPDPICSRSSEDLPPRSRGFLVNDIYRCTGCRDCESLCPVRCIKIENELGPDVSKTWVAVFDIDFARCTFCGLCVEACNPASLTHSKRYEGSVLELNDLVVSFGRGLVTTEQRAKWASIRELNEEGDY